MECSLCEGECVEHSKWGVACEDGVAAARREGVIEGLTAAAEIARDPRLSNWALRRLIRVEIKRIKGE